MAGGSNGLASSLCIEKYNLSKNYWQKLAVKLPMGIDGGVILPSDQPDELLLIGGYELGQPKKSVIRVNLKAKTYQGDTPLKNTRVLQKFILTNKEIIVLGGDKHNSIEFTGVDADKLSWQTTYNVVPKKCNLKLFSCANSNITLATSSSPYSSKQFIKDANYPVLFGNDTYPIIMHINTVLEEIRLLPVPTALKLLTYMSSCRINENQIFLGGGINSTLTEISKACYIYNVQTNEVTPLPEMNYFRYAFGCVCRDNQVYVMGGRGYQNDQLSLLSTCERYDLTSGQWESISSMSESKCTLSCFVLQGSVMVAGGYVGEGKKSQKLEKYNEGFDQWEDLGLEFPEGIEALSSCSNSQGSKVYFVGGSTHQEQENSVYELDIDKLGLEKVGQMQEKRCLSSLFKLGQDQICIMGGAVNEFEDTKQIEVFDLSTKQAVAATSSDLQKSKLLTELHNMVTALNIQDMFREFSCADSFHPVF